MSTNLFINAKVQSAFLKYINRTLNTISIFSCLLQTSSSVCFCPYDNHSLFTFLFYSFRSSQFSTTSHSTSDQCHILLIFINIISIHQNMYLSKNYYTFICSVLALNEERDQSFTKLGDQMIRKLKTSNLNYRSRPRSAILKTSWKLNIMIADC